MNLMCVRQDLKLAYKTHNSGACFGSTDTKKKKKQTRNFVVMA